MASLPTVSAKVVADVEGFVNEFKRAQRAAQSSSAAISGEVDKLTKGLKKKFQFADFGKDVLKGAGLFGGFQIAQTAASFISGYFEKAAEAAKSIAESSEKSLSITKQLIALNQTDSQRQAVLIRDREAARKAYEAAAAPKLMGKSGRGFGPQRVRENTDQENVAIAELRVAYEQAALVAAQGEKKLKEATGKAFVDDAMAQRKALEQRILEGNALFLRGEAERTQMIEKSAKAQADLDEMLAMERRKNLEQQILSGNKLFLEGQKDAQEKALKLSEKQALEFTRIVGVAADRIGDAFTDSLTGVEGAFQNLGKVVAKEMLAIIVKVSIIKPLFSAIGGLFGTGGGILGQIGAAFTGYGKPAAAGGYRDGTQPYLVGENGPEIFNPGKAGTITPNNKIGGGNTYYIDARGADVGVVDRLGQALVALAGPGVVEKRALAAVSNNSRR